MLDQGKAPDIAGRLSFMKLDAAASANIKNLKPLIDRELSGGAASLEAAVRASLGRGCPVVRCLCEIPDRSHAAAWRGGIRDATGASLRLAEGSCGPVHSFV